MATSSATNVTLGDAGRTWEQLAGQVEAFSAAWEAADQQPPGLADFVPASPRILRRLVLIELIKVDLDYRWRRQRAPRTIEAYREEFPELAEGGLPCDLLYEEFHVRKRAGEAVTPRDYLARFPEQAAELGRLLGVKDNAQTTQLYSGGPAQVDLQAGERLDDFDLLAELGRGRFARVFLARQRSMQRLVALKISADRGPEGQTLAQLDHPYIVRVFDQRQLPEKGLRLLYMQYIPGGTLQEVIQETCKVPLRERSGQTFLAAVDRALERRGESPPADSAPRARLAPLSWPEVVCWLGARLALALEHAANQGVFHRDVKPANVLLTSEGMPKLADFNVSFSSKLEGASPAAFFGGSLAYMSPEHLDAFNPQHPTEPEQLDARSDQYGLAVVLWELLIGQRPFPDEHLEESWPRTLEQMGRRRRSGLEPLEAQLPAACPPGLRRALLTCLAPEPAGRFSSGQELARQLLLCLHPPVQELLYPAPGGWLAFVRRFPALCVVLATLVPNSLAALFNYVYNRQAIIAALPEAKGAFFTIQLVINNVLFPLGIVLLIFLAHPVAVGLRELQAGGKPEAARLAWLRRRCLCLGHYTVGIGLAEWLAAAVAYPISMAFAVGEMPLTVFLHFIVSLGLCGLVAAAYPFFANTFLALRGFYPELIRSAPTGLADLEELAWVQRLTGRYLLLAAAVPLLAVTALVLTGSRNQFALLVLSAGGLAGLGLAFWFFRTLQKHLLALTSAVRPPEEMLIEPDSFASL